MCLLVLLGKETVSLARPWLVLHEISIIFHAPCFRFFETKYAGVDMLLNAWCSAISPSGLSGNTWFLPLPASKWPQIWRVDFMGALQLLLAYSLSTDWPTLLMPCYKFDVFLWNGHNLCTVSWQQLLAVLVFADWGRSARALTQAAASQEKQTGARFL